MEIYTYGSLFLFKGCAFMKRCEVRLVRIIPLNHIPNHTPKNHNHERSWTFLLDCLRLFGFTSFHGQRASLFWEVPIYIHIYIYIYVFFLHTYICLLVHGSQFRTIVYPQLFLGAKEEEEESEEEDDEDLSDLEAVQLQQELCYGKMAMYIAIAQSVIGNLIGFNGI